MSRASLGLLALASSLVATVEDARSTHAAAAGVSRPAWQREYGDDLVSLEYQGGALLSDGRLLLAVGAGLLEGIRPDEGTLQLWRLDDRGERAATLAVLEAEEEPAAGDPPSSRVRAVGEDGSVIVGSPVERTSLRRLAPSGASFEAKAPLPPDFTATGMVVTGERRNVVFGRRGGDAMAVSVDAGGQVLWERRRDGGGTGSFVAGLATAEGGCLLAANEGSRDMLGRGPSRIWIGHYDSRGGLLESAELPGRYGALTAGPENGYALVYDRGTSDGQEIVLRRMGANLRETAEVTIVKVELGFTSFGIAGVDGGFAIVGSRDQKPLVLRTDPRGTILWSYWGEQMKRSIDYDVFSLGDRFIVTSTIFGDDGKMKVRLLGFTA